MPSQPPIFHLPIESCSAELIFAPLHDPAAAGQVDLTLEAVDAVGVGGLQNWCWYELSWASVQAGSPAAILTVPFSNFDPRYDRLLCCVTVPDFVSVTVECEIGGTWTPAGSASTGTGSRMEMNLPLPEGEVTRVRTVFHATKTEPAMVKLHWLGLQDAGLLKHAERGRIRYDASWSGLLVDADASHPGAFFADLLFSAEDLPALRKKKELPGWREHFLVMETQARDMMKQAPEDQLSDYAPFTDERYTRARERDKWNYFNEGPLAAFVGLVNQDAEMIRWAGRTLMCMVHTPHWCQSAESRLPGSTWDMRAFVETMTTTAVALMADWLNPFLTNRARELIQQTLWDRGLSFIERDLMRFEYMHQCNQGPWFCEPRILAGLMLEKVWPRMGGYVDRALDDLQRSMELYLQPDGGTDEGMGYWALTYHHILPALLAYARKRDRDARDLLPAVQAKSETFIRVMSATEPGRMLLDGDNSTVYPAGDTMAIMAGLFPDSVYTELVGASLLEDRPFIYFDMACIKGVLGMIFGPETLPTPTCVVPTFGRLEHTGHLTSLRTDEQGRTIRIHFAGAKARPSHSHLDKSNVTLELDGVPVLIDRGIVRYDDPRGGVMPWSCLHNVITPVLADGSFGLQSNPVTPIIPDGTGDEQTLHASIDITPLWQDHFSRCIRRVDSDAPDSFVITDELCCPRETAIAFHLQAPAPFQIDGQTVLLEVKGKQLRIELPWAEHIEQREEGIDYAFQPVFHLVATSPKGREFTLETRFHRGT